MADDLTSIDRIGPKRAEMLADELDVHSFADLAALDADDVVAAFAARDRRVSQKEVALWIADAAQRTSVRADGWEIDSLFLVSFERRQDDLRTSAHRVGSEEEQHWSGHVASDVGAWMAARLEPVAADDDADATEEPDESEQRPEPDAVPPPPPELPPEPELVTSFVVFQPPRAADPVATGSNGNITAPLSAHVELAVELDVASGVARRMLRLRVKRIGAHPAFATPWQPARREPEPEDTRVVVTGLDAGLYRLQVGTVSDDDSHETQTQNGPLFVVE